MPTVLLIAYGNASRRDDGVAFHIIEHLRTAVGNASGDLDEDAEGSIVPGVEVIGLQQLAPELAEELIAHDAVIFIDAHVAGTPWQDVHWQAVQPEFRTSMVTHHLKPETLVALCQTLYGRVPAAYILSVLGSDFDFGDELSPATAARAEQAAAVLGEWCDLLRARN